MSKQDETIGVLDSLYKNKIDMKKAAELLSITSNELNRRIDNHIYKSDAADAKEVNKLMSDNLKHISYRTIMPVNSPNIEMIGIPNRQTELIQFEAGENLSDGDHLDIIDGKGYKAKAKIFSLSWVKMCIDDVEIRKIGQYAIVKMWSN